MASQEVTDGEGINASNGRFGRFFPRLPYQPNKVKNMEEIIKKVTEMNHDMLYDLANDMTRVISVIMHDVMQIINDEKENE
ncbi:MAG: hypothetical protein GY853_01060 [PVC group bacterium]|nr:hypothetical protein [PVC group bacterium]